MLARHHAMQNNRMNADNLSQLAWTALKLLLALPVYLLVCLIRRDARSDDTAHRHANEVARKPPAE